MYNRAIEFVEWLNTPIKVKTESGFSVTLTRCTPQAPDFNTFYVLNSDGTPRYENGFYPSLEKLYIVFDEEN